MTFFQGRKSYNSYAHLAAFLRSAPVPEILGKTPLVMEKIRRK
jgi:hypothetical protein